MRSGQVSQDFSQLYLEYLQEWSLHNLSGQTSLVLDHPCGENAFLYSQSKTPMFQFITIAFYPLTTHFSEVPDLPVGMGRLLSSKVISSLRGAGLAPSTSAKSSTPALIILVALHCTLSSLLTSFKLGGTKLDAVFQMWSNECQIRE